MNGCVFRGGEENCNHVVLDRFVTTAKGPRERPSDRKMKLAVKPRLAAAWMSAKSAFGQPLGAGDGLSRRGVYRS